MDFRKIAANIVAFGPIILFNIYSISSKEEGSGINWNHVMYAAVIAVISFSIAKKIRDKGKVEE